MSQESGGEWIVRLPDAASYQEYVDTYIEPSQKFPDVHFVFDPKVRVVKVTSKKMEETNRHLKSDLDLSSDLYSST
jgi:hypothetical protein